MLHSEIEPNQKIKVTSKTTLKKTNKKLYAWPVQRILDKETLELVGWVYQWNTGERGRTWENGEKNNVIYD